MTRKERYQLFIDYFSKNAPTAETELIYNNPYELLIAVVLSAQCTDKRVNMVTPILFQAYPNAYELSKATVDEVFNIIRSISYPNNKAKHLVGLAQKLTHEFKGEIPKEVDALQTLPGVGRKTANVITSVLWEQPRMAVDTHVYRVSKRLGLVTQTANTPLKVEKQLIQHLPTQYVHISHHWLILHGRYICTARNPKCLECPLADWCYFNQKNIRNAKK
jgi:endonuclease-3